MTDKEALDALRESFGVRWGFPANSPNLRRALTHRSATTNSAATNERLEFLGDALVSAFVAHHLMVALPDAEEGTLSRSRAAVVRKESLAKAARRIGLQDLLVVAPGERKENRHNSDAPLADAYEAVLGALFLDGGGVPAGLFVQETLAENLRAVVRSPTPPDPKTHLQILTQSNGLGLPTYHDLPAPPPNDGDEATTAKFYADVRAQDGTILGTGQGTSKRAAQTRAAQQAIEMILQNDATTKGDPNKP